MIYKCTKCGKTHEIKKVRMIIRNNELVFDVPKCECSGTIQHIEETGGYNVKINPKVGNTKNYY